MEDNFEKNVDKFDSEEFIDMKSDRKVIEQIVYAAQVLGERKLRSELKEMGDRYHKRKQKIYWMMCVAASIVLIVLFYFQFPKGDDVMVRDVLIEEAPTLMDSATFEADSVRESTAADSISD